jgi:hypothetical protein
MVRYYGLYANAHRGRVRKARPGAVPLRIVEEELRRIPAKGWAAMIRKARAEKEILILRNRRNGLRYLSNYVTHVRKPAF